MRLVALLPAVSSSSVGVYFVVLSENNLQDIVGLFLLCVCVRVRVCVCVCARARACVWVVLLLISSIGC